MYAGVKVADKRGHKTILWDDIEKIETAKGTETREVEVDDDGDDGGDAHDGLGPPPKRRKLDCLIHISWELLM